MSVPEPKLSSVPSGSYEGRWRWWYSAISDWMIENPGHPWSECAKALSKTESTICTIANTDLFRDFHSQRLQAWREAHDFALANKLTGVAEKGLDLLLEVMTKKGDQVPLKSLVEITSSSLEKLGYGVKPTAPVVNVQQNNATVYVPVSPGDLEEARNALRVAERSRSLTYDGSALPAPSTSKAEAGGGDVLDALIVEGGLCAPPTLDS